MKVVIPMAGKGTRLKPHTHTTPKALVHVAGKPLLEHVLDSISDLTIDTVIFIVDKDYPELRKFLDKKYSFKQIYILQKERKGVAHAIYGAKKHVINEDVFILFADTLMQGDLKIVKKHKNDGLIWTKKVTDPRQYGVAFLHDNFISQLIEKPEEPVSDKALVGMYYFKDGNKLFESIEYLLKNDIRHKGEFYLTDAIQYLISKGLKFQAPEVTSWLDCGTVQSLLMANKELLKKVGTKTNTAKNTIFIKPVYIEKGVEIANSIIGPDVSISKGAVINGSIIKDSIVNENAIISDALLTESIIGKNTKIQGRSKKLNIGDSSEIFYS